MSDHTSAPTDDTSDDLLRRHGFVGDALPDGVAEQCQRLRDAVGAEAVEMRPPGGGAPLLRFGGKAQDGADERGASDEARDEARDEATAEVRTSAGELLGTLVVRGAAPPEDGASLDASMGAAASAVAALAELEEARGRLFHLEEQLARADDALAAAAGQVVHDLNNPLAAIAMCLEIAREQVSDGDLLASLLDRASGSAAKLKRMVAALADYGQQPVAGVTDLAAEVPQLLADFAPLLDETVRVEGELPVVALAPGDVRTVLTALWENAAKFRRDDVDLEVVVRAEPVRDPLGGRWRIRVSDNGKGIPPEDAVRVLNPTVRLDKRVPGSGLGLATVRRVVAAAGGTVGVEPAADQATGTTVWFEVPAAGPPAEGPPGHR